MCRANSSHRRPASSYVFLERGLCPFERRRRRRSATETRIAEAAIDSHGVRSRKTRACWRALSSKLQRISRRRACALSDAGTVSRRNAMQVPGFRPERRVTQSHGALYQRGHPEPTSVRCVSDQLSGSPARESHVRCECGSIGRPLPDRGHARKCRLASWRLSRSILPRAARGAAQAETARDNSRATRRRSPS